MLVITRGVSYPMPFLCRNSTAISSVLGYPRIFSWRCVKTWRQYHWIHKRCRGVWNHPFGEDYHIYILIYLSFSGQQIRKKWLLYPYIYMQHNDTTYIYIYTYTEKIPKCHYEHFIAIIFQDVSRRKRAFHHFYQPFCCRPYPPFWGDLHRRCVTDLKFASGCCWGRKMVACHRLKLWFKNQHGDQNLVS